MTNKPLITAVVLTKNEEAGIDRCLDALTFCNQVIVVDSDSKDRTIELARRSGAEVVPFNWNGRYPKKKQWGMEHPVVRNDWVLHLDADEIVSSALAREMIQQVATASRRGIVAFDIPLAYHFAGKELKHGHRVYKRSLVNRAATRFPEVGDLDAPGITEVEGHYQPTINGKSLTLSNRLIHDDPDPVSSWVARHNRYSDWEAHLRTNTHIRSSVRASRSTQGKAFDVAPFKPLAFFIYSYIIRLGVLDGRAGFHYAFALSWYYWLIGLKTSELQRAGTP